MARTTDKRDRLITAAMQLILHSGYNQTTLALIASHSAVPLGNVYYYFKTKDAIGEAVLMQLHTNLNAVLADLDNAATPAEKLQGFLNYCLEDLEAIATYGCPVGGLCQELCKQTGSLAAHAAAIMQQMLQWLESQYVAQGNVATTARSKALSLLATVQGARLLALTFKDPDILGRQVNMILERLEVGSLEAVV